MKKILIISGKQGAGKTSLTEALLSKLIDRNVLVKQAKFAEPLYEMHNKCLPILQEYGIRPEEMRKDGELLQVLGTEYGRMRIAKDVWVKACRRSVDAYLELEGRRVVLIDDCRFENEFDAFPDAFRVRLECPTAVRFARCSYWRDNDSHPSEVGLDRYAELKRFDMILNTQINSLQDAADILFDMWRLS